MDANTQTEEVCTQNDEAQTNDMETEELGIQTNEVLINIDISITMPNMASGDILLKTGVHTDKKGVLDDFSSAGELGAVGAVRAARGAATDGIFSRTIHDDVTKDSNDVSAATATVSHVSDEDPNENLHAIDAITYTATVGKESSAVTAGSPAAVTFAAVDKTSKGSRAKNLFSRTATVFSVMNQAHKESESVETKQITNEMESYQGDGHAHGRNLEKEDNMSDASCSRDVWAAARDDLISLLKTQQSLKAP